jgi:hypothetical protein
MGHINVSVKILSVSTATVTPEEAPGAFLYTVFERSVYKDYHLYPLLTSPSLCIIVCNITPEEAPGCHLKHESISYNSDVLRDIYISCLSTVKS